MEKMKTSQKMMKFLPQKSQCWNFMREDERMGVVSVQKGPWVLTLFNESRTGVRMVIEQYWPKAINASLIRNMVSHLYIK